MITVIAKQIVKEGMVEQFKESVKPLIAETREEAGCIKYELAQDVNDKKVLAMVEAWESMEHLQAHMQSKHFLAAMPKLAGFMEKEADVNIYQTVL